MKPFFAFLKNHKKHQFLYKSVNEKKILLKWILERVWVLWEEWASIDGLRTKMLYHSLLHCCKDCYCSVMLSSKMTLE